MTVALADTSWLPVRLWLDVWVPVAEEDKVGTELGARLNDCVDVAVCVGLELVVMLAVCDRLVDWACVGVELIVVLAVCDRLADCVVEGVILAVRERLAVGVELDVRVLLCVWERLAVCDSEGTTGASATPMKGNVARDTILVTAVPLVGRR